MAAATCGSGSGQAAGCTDMTHPFRGRDEGKERPQQEITAISAALTEDLAWRVGN